VYARHHEVVKNVQMGFIAREEIMFHAKDALIPLRLTKIELIARTRKLEKL
jgi:hypothetical protein